VESFGRKNLAWASMGIQAHRLDAKVHILDEREMTWIEFMMTWMT
jgi:hypothetical protein